MFEDGVEKIYDDTPSLAIMTLRGLKYCVTPSTVFKSPVAPTYSGRELDSGEDLGLVFMPRKYLTEELNGVKTDIRLMETRVVFDCKVKKRPLTFEHPGRNDVAEFSEPVKKKKKPYVLPSRGDVIKLVANGISRSDKRTPNNITARVIEVKQGMIKIRPDGDFYISKSKKYALVTMDLELEGQHYKQSIMADHYNPIYYNAKIKLI